MNNCGQGNTSEHGGLRLYEKPHPWRERREYPRGPCDRTWIVAFYNSAYLYQGYMLNLSTGGARLLHAPEAKEPHPILTPGRAMECYVTTPHGRSKFRGVIQWSTVNPTSLMWGITFIELSASEWDPLRVAIDATLQIGLMPGPVAASVLVAAGGPVIGIPAENLLPRSAAVTQPF